MAGFGGVAEAVAERCRELLADVRIGGMFRVECYGPDGGLKWADDAKNGVVNAGVNHILNTEFAGGTQSTTWYMGLIGSTSFTGLAAGDTMSGHSGWTEATNYSGARPQWGAGTTSNQTTTNASTTNFSMTGSGTIKGVFVVDNSTQGGTTGNLWGTALFSGGDQTVANGDTLKITYTVNGSGS